MNKFYSEETISAWSDLLSFYYCNKGKWRDWVFRGQSDYQWDLSSSLERAFDDYDIVGDGRLKKEKGLVRRFERQYHLYSNNVPEPNSYIEWFSIMQHYGCPTRLLDFTYSFFIALFFSIEKNGFQKGEGFSKKSESSIWAINIKWLEKRFKDKANPSVKPLLEKDPNIKENDTVREILNNPQAFILNINPLRFNERLVSQQSIFVMPLDLRVSFMDNICGVSDNIQDIRDNIKKIKIEYTIDFLKDAFYDLNRMNINRATLFPGIDGYAHYLRMLIAIDNDDFLVSYLEEF